MNSTQGLHKPDGIKSRSNKIRRNPSHNKPKPVPEPHKRMGHLTERHQSFESTNVLGGGLRVVRWCNVEDYMIFTPKLVLRELNPAGLLTWNARIFVFPIPTYKVSLLRIIKQRKVGIKRTLIELVSGENTSENNIDIYKKNAD